MQAEADQLKLPAAGYYGLLAHDEMKIQVSVIFWNSTAWYGSLARDEMKIQVSAIFSNSTLILDQLGMVCHNKKNKGAYMPYTWFFI